MSPMRGWRARQNPAQVSPLARQNGRVLPFTGSENTQLVRERQETGSVLSEKRNPRAAANIRGFRLFRQSRMSSHFARNEWWALSLSNSRWKKSSTESSNLAPDSDSLRRPAPHWRTLPLRKENPSRRYRFVPL